MTTTDAISSQPMLSRMEPNGTVREALSQGSTCSWSAPGFYARLDSDGVMIEPGHATSGYAVPAHATPGHSNAFSGNAMNEKIFTRLVARFPHQLDPGEQPIAKVLDAPINFDRPIQPRYMNSTQLFPQIPQIAQIAQMSSQVCPPRSRGEKEAECGCFPWLLARAYWWRA